MGGQILSRASQSKVLGDDNREVLKSCTAAVCKYWLYGSWDLPSADLYKMIHLCYRLPSFHIKYKNNLPYYKISIIYSLQVLKG